MTTWNSLDKSANVTLSGGSLVAATTNSTQGGVRATTGLLTGKIYFECVYNTSNAGAAYGVGWANATASLATFFGTDTNGFGTYVNQQSGGVFGSFFFNNINQGNGPGTARAGITVCIAFDIDNKLVWARYDTSFWNNSPTADPATGTGGLSLPTLAAGPYFPAFCCNASGGQVTANFGATDFWFAPPSGFSGLDINTQAFNASSKFVGFDVLSPPQTTAEAAKFIGYDPLAPSQNAVVAAKLVGYAILLPLTATPRSQGYIYG